MKKLILLVLAAVVMAGCEDIRVKSAITQSPALEYHTYVIDSCEYIGRLVNDFGNADRNYLSHKGNCRFCEERRQKELEELVEQLKQNNYGNNYN